MPRPTVLVISDRPLVFDRIRIMLEPAFDTLALVAHTESIVSSVAAMEPMILVVDLRSVDIRGREVVERIRASLPNQRVIALDGETELPTPGLETASVRRAAGFVELSLRLRELMGGWEVRSESSPPEAAVWISRFGSNQPSSTVSCCDK
jgi:CheY-like chemotaxis protein